MKVLDKIVGGMGENEDLPPGWKKEIKVRKGSSGTKYDKFYTDPVTGYIFHSLKDVQRYLKTGEVGRLASKPKSNGDNGCVVMANEDKKVHVGVKVEDREQMSETWRSKRPLEEGPGGYNKTRSKISETEPKPRQATQHSSIKTDAPSPSPSRPEPKSRQATRQTVIKIDATPPTPSPSPSQPEPKTRQATRQAGIKIDSPPPSPPDIRSNRQATRQAGVKVQASAPPLVEPKTRQATQQAGIEIDPSIPLPEPKTRQATRQAGIKIDSPPPSPPDIRSNRQATRQAGVKVEASAPPPVEPKTSQATQQAGIEINPSIPPPEPKTLQATRQAGIKIDSPPPSPPDIRSNCQATRQAGVKVDPSIPLPEPKTRQATRQSTIKTDAPPSSTSPPEPKTRRATRQAGIKIDSPPGSRNIRQATQQAGIQINAVVPVSSSAEPETSEATRETSEATRVTGVEIDASAATPTLEPKTSKATLVIGTETVASPAPMPEPKTRQAKRPAGSRDNALPASPPPTKTRKATRLSGIKIDSPPPSLPDTRTNRQSTARHVNITTSKENDKQAVEEKITNNHHENADMNGNKQENSIIIPPVSQASHEKDELKTIEEQENRNVLPLTTVNGHFKEMKTGKANLPPTEDQPPPAVVPPVNMEKQELPEVDPTVSNPVPQSMNFSLNDLWTDPCIEFAVKTLTGAIPFGDLNKVGNFSPSVPMEEFWTDPCIEFAVKTLTGAISENDYLNHMPASSSNQQPRHDYSLPDVSMNFCQTEVLSKHFETGHNNKQQDSMVSTLGNSGLQKSGNVVNGSNGQCSRSRFSP
nr:hypothetical protein [Tanacetum cinerariifolium]